MFYRTSSWAMTEGHNGDLWFAISSGVCRYNPVTGRMIKYLPNEEDKESLLGTYILDIFEDNYNGKQNRILRTILVYLEKQLRYVNKKRVEYLAIKN